MKTHLDLGEIDRTCLLFGGPYGNLQASRALLAAAGGLGIPARRMICTGDIVAYCGDPAATVDLVRESGMHVIKGNCEESLVADATDCGCGFAEGSACEALSQHWYRYSRSCLGDGHLRWMRRLPNTIGFSMAGRRFLVIHGGVSAISRFVFPATELSVKRQELGLAGTDTVIAGHSGIPFTQRVDRAIWHNPGVIGMPANDGTPRVWYSTLQPANDSVVFRHHALHYDHDGARLAMKHNGLPSAYMESLHSGIWPDDEVMPPPDRARRGESLDLAETKW